MDTCLRCFSYACLFALSAGQFLTEEVDSHGGLSMLQRQAAIPKPWESNVYIIGNYHKSGVHMTGGIFFKIFFSLGMTTSSAGNMVYPCSLLNTCFNPDAHVLQVTDMFDPSYAQKVREKHQKPVFASIAVRDPLMMVASAYCYHHEGQEPLNANFPSKVIKQLGFEEGTNFTAQRMLPFIHKMADSFEDPSIHAIKFERLVESSESFDLEVKKLIDFMFPKLLSSSQRQAALEASWSYDLRRNNLDPGHTNSKDCEQTALKATDKMDPVLLRSLHELRERLGYH